VSGRRRVDPGGAPTGAAPTAQAIVGQLASPLRLRVVAAVVLGARTPSQVAERVDAGADDVAAALTRLMRAGLLSADGEGFTVRSDVFAQAARAEAPRRVPEPYDGLDPSIAKVLRVFLVDGRLTSIPVAGRKRRVVLEHLVSVFEPGQRYSELQVNVILRAWHDDVAALRRYLVEAGLLAREAGEYWRIGGWLDVG
jgi:hypothetical protein